MYSHGEDVVRRAQELRALRRAQGPARSAAPRRRARRPPARRVSPGPAWGPAGPPPPRRGPRRPRSRCRTRARPPRAGRAAGPTAPRAKPSAELSAQGSGSSNTMSAPQRARRLRAGEFGVHRRLAALHEVARHAADDDPRPPPAPRACAGCATGGRCERGYIPPRCPLSAYLPASLRKHLRFRAYKDTITVSIILYLFRNLQ